MNTVGLLKLKTRKQWMCGVTRRDEIRNKHIRGSTIVVQASKKITEKRR